MADASLKAQRSWKKEPRLSVVRMPRSDPNTRESVSMAGAVSIKLSRWGKNERLVRAPYEGDFEKGLPEKLGRMFPRNGETLRFSMSDGAFRPAKNAPLSEKTLYSQQDKLIAFPSGHLLAIVEGLDEKGQTMKKFLTGTLTILTPPYPSSADEKALKGVSNDHVLDLAHEPQELGLKTVTSVRIFFSPVSDLTPYLKDPEGEVAKGSMHSLFAPVVVEPDQHQSYNGLGLKKEDYLDFSPAKGSAHAEKGVSTEETLKEVSKTLQFEELAEKSGQKRKRSPSPSPQNPAAPSSKPITSAASLSPSPEKLSTPSTPSSESPDPKEPLHWRPDMSFVSVKYPAGSAVDDVVKRFRLPSVPGGEVVKVGDEVYLISAPGELDEETYAALENVSLADAQAHLAIIHGQVFQPYHVGISAGQVEAKNDTGTDVVHTASSGGGSSGGTVVDAYLPPRLLAIHQGSASEFAGNNALTVNHNFFRRGYCKYVLPHLDVHSLDNSRRELLKEFCHSLDADLRQALDIMDDIATIEEQLGA